MPAADNDQVGWGKKGLDKNGYLPAAQCSNCIGAFFCQAVMAQTRCAFVEGSMCIGKNRGLQFTAADRPGCRSILQQDDLGAGFGWRSAFDFDHRRQDWLAACFEWLLLVSQLGFGSCRIA